MAPKRLLSAGLWRRQPQQGEQQSTLAPASRYYKRLLYGGAVVLSSVILAIAGVLTYAVVMRFLDSQHEVFQQQREQVKAQVDRYEARLKQIIESYELMWSLHDKDWIPLEKYQHLLREGRGVAISKEDLTATPFSLMTSLTQAKDSPRLGMLLRIIREVSAAPKVRQLEMGQALGGFTYTPDRSFLAVVPPLAPEMLQDAQKNGVTPAITRQVESVEAMFSGYSQAELLRQRIFWVPLYDDLIDQGVATFFGAPLFRDGKRVAVVLVRIPFDHFSLYFQQSAHKHGFFVVARDRRQLFGRDDYDEQETRWSETLLRNPDISRRSNEQFAVIYRDGTFFLTQLIPGPDWIAVYVFDWAVVLRGIQIELWPILLVTLVVLLLLWGLVRGLDRKVFAPLQERSRLVYESEAFNRIVLATAPVGLSVVAPGGSNILLQNEITANLLQHEPDGGLSFYRRLLERAGKDQQAPGEPTKQEGESRHAEASVRQADGSELDIAAAFSQTYYQNQPVILFGLTDISKRKQTERLLLEAKLTADSASLAKSMFLATMSHEIRTPLHGALGNLELLDLEPLLPAQKERVSLIRRSFDALLSLINDILDLSKVEAGELVLSVERLNLADVLESCAQIFAPLLTRKQVRFFLAVDPRLDTYLLGDAQRITQVVLNLLSNATKFTHAGAITLSARPIPRESDSRAWVRIEVADSGIGIAPGVLGTIFSPFTQASPTISRQFGGTGLGLTLCKRLAELLGGSIGVESEEGVGSIFAVELPLAQQGQQDAEISAPAELQRKPILLVSDAPPWLDALAAQLRSWGALVTTAEQVGHFNGPGFIDSALLVVAYSDTEAGLAEALSQQFPETVLISMSGPLYPELRDAVLHVSAYSRAALRAALVACGSASAQEQASATSSTQQPQVLANAAILIAEDDPVNRTLLRQQLTSLGYRQVDVAEDGRSALALCQRKRYDLLLTDLGMPGLDGRELLQAIREQGVLTPVILTTASALALQEVNSGADKFAQVLHKPVSLNQLRAALATVLQTPGDKDPQLDEAGILPAQIDLDLKEAFVQSWPADRVAMQRAVSRGDSALFLRRLHRIKGAFLVLQEGVLVAQSEALRLQAERYGIEALSDPIMQFMHQAEVLVQRYLFDLAASSALLNPAGDDGEKGRLSLTWGQVSSRTAR